MTHRNRQILCAVLLIEVVCFAYAYFWGDQGLRALWRMRTESALMEEQNSGAQQVVVALEREVELWKDQPFYREKVAREQLQMSRKGDTVYYIS